MEVLRLISRAERGFYTKLLMTRHTEHIGIDFSAQILRRLLLSLGYHDKDIYCFRFADNKGERVQILPRNPY